ncbi:toll/interleukin-1 receptor domain-containing protein [Klebsiella michiganensis]|uniref:toll/interleukin-1 receptor domain-containing protein n=1 Tax=Klebsiella michiganensis TaxID=1134687 RepID=UPI001E498223|nr:toll/interleukin-1 receptor domain-containing protein [Klebsiella michiganensis]
MGEISVKTGNNARNGGKNSLNRLIRCVCGKKIGPDPRNFNQRVSLGRNDLLIRTFPSLVRDNRPPSTAQSDEIHDVFISHASEDKDDFVRSLANSLISHGLNVWYDEMTLRIGDSLRQKIDKGLANSRVGLVVLSPAFISKGWTNYELDGIVTRAISGEQILLPIWHNITKQEVIDFSPSLADKVARSTATHTIDEIAHEIAELLHSCC